MDFLKNDNGDRQERKKGLYLTVIFHLIVLIILLATGIGTMIREETSFVLDFSKMEEEEMKKEIEEHKEEIRELAAKELQMQISGNRSKIRNVAVDRSSGEKLKDDRFKNPSEVYDQARELQKKLDASKREAEKYRDSEEDIAIKKANAGKDKGGETYTGPSVISYTLDGRKAIRLSVPAYKCYGGGDVTVAILVNRAGNVIKAEVVENISATDNCLREYAVKAAKMSRFTASSKAEEKQAGEIVYRFIAQ